MTTYTVDISLGPRGSAPTHTWTINAGDVPDPSDPSQVLDGLTISWAQPEDEPFPAQPDPVTAQLSLLLDDAAQLDDLTIGDVCNITVTSGAATLAQFSGGIAQPIATPVKRLDPVTGATVLKVRFDLLAVEFYAELADLKITADWPAESFQARAVHVHEAIAAARGTDYATWNLGGDGVNTAIVEAASPRNASALDILLELVGNWTEVGAITGRLIFCSLVNDDTGDWSPKTRDLKPIPGSTGYSAYPPGVLTLTAHALGLDLDGASPSPSGLLIDAGRIELDSIRYAALKYATVRTIKLSGQTAGLVEVSNSSEPGRDYAASTILTDPANVEVMARTKLPPADASNWILDKFTWRPSDAELAALDYPLVPVSQAVGVLDSMIEQAPVAIANVPTGVQPGGDPFYAGTFSALTLTIRKGAVLVTGQLARRIVAAPDRSVTWADLAANFSTVHWSSGTDVVDPDLSWFAAGLARKM